VLFITLSRKGINVDYYKNREMINLFEYNSNLNLKIIIN